MEETKVVYWVAYLECWMEINKRLDCKKAATAAFFVDLIEHCPPEMDKSRGNVHEGCLSPL